jgi:gliding motility-associated-like protein
MYGLDTTDPNEMVLIPDFENIAPGPHFLTIAHSNGCVQSVDFEVDSFEALGLSAENTNINEITLTATGGSPDYSYALNDGPFQADPVFLIKETATHVLTVRDALGCESQISIFVEFFDIEFPNFFTPNHDGENDVWKPLHMEPHPNIIVKVFDRFGRCVHTLGRDDTGWEGLYQDTKMPTGDYWYVVKLNGEEDDREFVGHFTLYR